MSGKRNNRYGGGNRRSPLDLAAIAREDQFRQEIFTRNMIMNTEYWQDPSRMPDSKAIESGDLLVFSVHSDYNSLGIARAAFGTVSDAVKRCTEVPSDDPRSLWTTAALDQLTKAGAQFHQHPLRKVSLTQLSSDEYSLAPASEYCALATIAGRLYMLLCTAIVQTDDVTYTSNREFFQRGGPSEPKLVSQAVERHAKIGGLYRNQLEEILKACLAEPTLKHLLAVKLAFAEELLDLCLYQA